MKKINLSPDAIKKAANCLRILSHPVRLRIIQLLLEKELSVGAISKACNVPQNVASTHLKTLERCNFLEGTREGKNVYYKVIESHLEDLLRCIEKRFS